MIKIGFKRHEFDNCVYEKHSSADSFIYLLLYVNDMLIACPNMHDIEGFKKPTQI